MQARSVKPIKLGMIAEWVIVSALVLLAFCHEEILGDLSRRMMNHIVLMAIAAPVLAASLRNLVRASAQLAGIKTLISATTLQIILFVAWHFPPGPAMNGHGGDGIMQAALLFSALWFWLAVFNQGGNHPWRSVIALLLTAKLFCLIAVLMTFAPNVLYPGMSVSLADQQLAGSLMILACPITYVLAAIVLIYRWFQALCDSPYEMAHLALTSENKP